jgi:hypothetical protein
MNISCNCINLKNGFYKQCSACGQKKCLHNFQKGIFSNRSDAIVKYSNKCIFCEFKNNIVNN